MGTMRMLAGVKVFTHEENGNVLDEEAETTWIIGLPSNFTCDQVHSFLEDMPAGSSPVFEGCRVHLVEINATVAALEQELKLHPGSLYAERDMPIDLIPDDELTEIEAAGVGA